MFPLLIGFLIGSIGSIPPAGPTSVLVLHRALKGKPMSALALAVGGALPEAAYAALALWGVGHLVLGYPWLRWIGPVMAGVVVVLSIRDLARRGLSRDRPAEQVAKWTSVLEHRRGLVHCLLLGFTTAALNITLLFTWTAVAALVHQIPWVKAHLQPWWLMPVGVFLGIIAWFALAIVLADRWSARRSTESAVPEGQGPAPAKPEALPPALPLQIPNAESVGGGTEQGRARQ